MRSLQIFLRPVEQFLLVAVTTRMHAGRLSLYQDEIGMAINPHKLLNLIFCPKLAFLSIPGARLGVSATRRYILLYN